MNKLLFGIFAHPDDEAFGPSGTLLKRVRDGEKLHLICVTKGQAGMNPDGVPDLGEVREREWRAAGRRIGATSMHNLGYQDGTLSNQYFHEIADKIDYFVRDACKKYDEPVELRFMTFDTNGLSGHLDHIAVSHITTYLYYRLKTESLKGVEIASLDYFCMTREQVPRPDIGFVFMPAGREEGYVTKTVDVSDVLDDKIAIMREHHTQRSDADSIMAAGKQLLAYENFHEVRD
jgi:N-acetyl-1-D-myo-inositol-2-amino-2-deoxy-alpha-D-glucopyranoside deacetylase